MGSPVVDPNLSWAGIPALAATISEMAITLGLFFRSEIM
jgi:hypothetical protein